MAEQSRKKTRMSKLGFPGRTSAGPMTADYGFGMSSVLPTENNDFSKKGRKVIPTNLPSRGVFPTQPRPIGGGQITNLPSFQRPMITLEPRPVGSGQISNLPGRLPVQDDMSKYPYSKFNTETIVENKEQDAVRLRALLDYFAKLQGMQQ